MIIDSSALVAILQDEPEAPAFSRLIAHAPAPVIAAPSWLETAMVIEGRADRVGETRLDDLIEQLGIDIVPVDAALARRARAAWRVYGRGRHPAALNFGDCFAYALAQSRREPLLFKGDDFARTDITPALPNPALPPA